MALLRAFLPSIFSDPRPAPIISSHFFYYQGFCLVGLCPRFSIGLSGSVAAGAETADVDAGTPPPPLAGCLGKSCLQHRGRTGTVGAGAFWHLVLGLFEPLTIEIQRLFLVSFF